MRRADGAALAVRRERLVSRSSLTLEPPLIVASASPGGPGDGGTSQIGSSGVVVPDRYLPRTREFGLCAAAAATALSRR